jgi:hypothetical protein
MADFLFEEQVHFEQILEKGEVMKGLDQFTDFLTTRR